MLVYYLLKNKIVDKKFEEYKNIIIKAIDKAGYEREYDDRNINEFM